ncbi:MAG: DUF6377 domain-containing protein [Bacteroidetes bacterium]|nr:DUF6377 domain-containing protein [Bacteroidota bacterium]
MKYKFLLLFFFSFVFIANANESDDSLYMKLDTLLEQKQTFIQQKQKRIALLNQQLKDSEHKKEIQFQYQTCSTLFEEYKSFQYDSAYKYTDRMLVLAYKLNDAAKINTAKSNVSFLLLSAGMFKEALDTLTTINALALPVPERINFYKVFARTYFDLSDFFQNQQYNRAYNSAGDEHLKKALALLKTGEKEYLFIKGWQYMRVRNIELAIKTFEKLLLYYTLSDHEYAIVTSSLSFMFMLDGNVAKHEEFLVKAAMADIRASVTETVALRNIAEILYNEEQFERSYRYIKIANDDAYAYGAKFRQVQIAHLLPMIEAANMIEVESKQRNLIMVALVASLISVLIFILYFIVYRNNIKLKLAKASIVESHQRLQELNNVLLDANKIKEEYIGHFFKTISEYIDKLDKLKNSIDRKITQKRTDQIQDIIKQINLKAEREELYGSFDQIFLKIFPDFVTKFNTFINENEKYVLEENAPLPPELRIFALIRLGISDNEKIAQFLGYSINTIYTYKTRLKNKTIIPNEKLEARVMEIKAN